MTRHTTALSIVFSLFAYQHNCYGESALQSTATDTVSSTSIPHADQPSASDVKPVKRYHYSIPGLQLAFQVHGVAGQDPFRTFGFYFLGGTAGTNHWQFGTRFLGIESISNSYESLGFEFLPLIIQYHPFGITRFQYIIPFVYLSVNYWGTIISDSLINAPLLGSSYVPSKVNYTNPGVLDAGLEIDVRHDYATYLLVCAVSVLASAVSTFPVRNNEVLSYEAYKESTSSFFALRLGFKNYGHLRQLANADYPTVNLLYLKVFFQLCTWK